MTTARRLAIALVLVAATAGLCVVEAATYDQRWDYPSTEQIVSDYESVVGERVFLTGPVQDRNGTTVSMVADTESGTRTLAVTGVDVDVQPGGTIQALGTLEPDGTVETERVVVVNASADAQRLKWLLSLVAVVGFLALFGWTWRVDLRSLRVEVRDDG